MDIDKLILFQLKKQIKDSGDQKVFFYRNGIYIFTALNKIQISLSVCERFDQKVLNSASCIYIICIYLHMRKWNKFVLLNVNRYMYSCRSLYLLYVCRAIRYESNYYLNWFNLVLCVIYTLIICSYKRVLLPRWPRIIPLKIENVNETLKQQIKSVGALTVDRYIKQRT